MAQGNFASQEDLKLKMDPDFSLGDPFVFALSKIPLKAIHLESLCEKKLDG